MDWDFNDQLKRVDLRGGGTAHYIYDASGQRVRKEHKHVGTLLEERIYLGDFEIYRKHNANSVKLERETLHFMDDKERIALVETRTFDLGGNDPAPQQLIRYQLNNHLGSATVELDDKAMIISYEEFTPYGSTCYQAVIPELERPKRFRFTGKERDEETGFTYHGARYYAPWLGRWISVDPAWLADGTNTYHYASNNPIQLMDPSGMQPLHPVPEPRNTPDNFVSEASYGRAGKNWDKAVNEVLEPLYHGGSIQENLEHFRSDLQSDRFIEGGRKKQGTRKNYASERYNEVRKRFYELEYKNPSFTYSDVESTFLKEGRAPRAGFQLHHVIHIKTDPSSALNAGNLVFTQAGPKGGLSKGSPHEVLHTGEGAKNLERFQAKSVTSSSPSLASRPSLRGGAGTTKKVIGAAADAAKSAGGFIVSKGAKAIPVVGIVAGGASAVNNLRQGNFGAAIVDVVGIFSDPVEWVIMGTEELAERTASPELRRPRGPFHRYDMNDPVDRRLVEDWAQRERERHRIMSIPQRRVGRK